MPPLSKMESLSPARIATALLLALPLVACGPTDEADRAQSGPIKGAFLVSNYFTPSGLMGDGAIPDRVTVDINQNCKKRLPGAQGDCYRFTYFPGDVHWAGAFWSYPANNWGSTRGRQVMGPKDLGVDDPDRPQNGRLRGYDRVRVKFAMCQPEPGMTYCPCGPDNSLKCPPLAPNDINFWVGKLDGRNPPAGNGPPQPYYDEGCSVFPGMPATADTPATAPIITCSADQPLKNPDGTAKLNPDGTPVTVKVPAFFKADAAPATADVTKADPADGGWQRAEVDMRLYAPQRIIGGFGFSANDDKNKVCPPPGPPPGEDCLDKDKIGLPQVIYLDDIVWE